MVIKTIPVGPLETNCYIVADEETGKAMIVDPGDEPDRILAEAEGLDIQYIVLTHAHFDHVGAAGDIKEATAAVLALHGDDLPVYGTVKDQAAFWGYDMGSLPQPDLILKEGDELLVGDMSFVVIHTPGHTPGGICLYGGGTLISGDTLFAGSVGRTDFPGGSLGKLKESFRKLMALPGGTQVLSGHGPATTIGREREGNIFSHEFLTGL